MLFKKIKAFVDFGDNQNAAKQVSWSEDRYNAIIMQRNVVFVMLLMCMIVIGISVIVVNRISISKKFEPFVVQIDEKVGSATIVNPEGSNVIDGNDALARFFVKRYVTARETYNPVDFNSISRRTIRLMSSDSIYRQYLNYMRDQRNDPTIVYGTENTTSIKMKSWSKIDKNKYMMRFTIYENSGEMRSFNKLAILETIYAPMELSEEDMEINPVGFLVTNYRVDDDNS